MNLRHLWHPPHIHRHPPHHSHIDPPPPGGLILHNVAAENERKNLELTAENEILRTRPLFMPVTAGLSLIVGLFVSINALTAVFGKPPIPLSASDFFLLIFPGIWFAMIAIFVLAGITAFLSAIILMVMAAIWSLFTWKSVSPTGTEWGGAVMGGWVAIGLGIIFWLVAGLLN